MSKADEMNRRPSPIFGKGETVTLNLTRVFYSPDVYMNSVVFLEYHEEFPQDYERLADAIFTLLRDMNYDHASIVVNRI